MGANAASLQRCTLACESSSPIQKLPRLQLEPYLCAGAAEPKAAGMPPDANGRGSDPAAAAPAGGVRSRWLAVEAEEEAAQAASKQLDLQVCSWLLCSGFVMLFEMPMAIWEYETALAAS